MRSRRFPARAAWALALALASAATAPAQDLARVPVQLSRVPVRQNLVSTGAHPVALATRADGSGWLGYGDNRGSIRVAPLDAQQRRAGPELVVEGHGFVGVHAAEDGGAVLLASTEEGPNDQRPDWCASGHNTLWAIKLDAAGKQVFRTRLVGGQGYGPQQIWFIPGSAGVIAGNGAVYGAFYSVGKNFAQPGQPPNPHEGDEFKAIAPDGIIREDLSCTWNASHSIDQRMVVVGGEFYTGIMGDAWPMGVLFKAHPSRTRSILWPDRALVEPLQKTIAKVFMPGELGGIARRAGGFALVATVFVRDSAVESTHRERRDVLLLCVDDAGRLQHQRRIALPGMRRGLRACVATFGRHLLLGWGDPGTPRTTLTVVGADGAEVVAPFVVKFAMPERDPFHTLPDGDVVWVSARSGSKKVQLHRLAVPGSMRAAAQQAPAPQPPAAPEEATPQPPAPRGAVRQVETTYADGSVKTRYHVDADQQRTGTFTRFYPTGEVKETATYAGGKRWGPCEEFDRSGQRRCTTTYVDGLEHGVRREFDAAGKLVRTRRYAAGEPVEK